MALTAKFKKQTAKWLEAEVERVQAAIVDMDAQQSALREASSETSEADFSEEGGDPDGAVVERDRLRVALVDAAERLEELAATQAALEAGDYGICRVCEKEIPEERLEALPATRLCVNCKAGGH